MVRRSLAVALVTVACARTAARAARSRARRMRAGGRGHVAPVELVHARARVAARAPGRCAARRPCSTGCRAASARPPPESRARAADRGSAWKPPVARISGTSPGADSSGSPTARRRRPPRHQGLGQLRGVEAHPGREGIAGVARRAAGRPATRARRARRRAARTGCAGGRGRRRAFGLEPLELAVAPDDAARQQHRAARRGRPSRAAATRGAAARARRAAAARPAMPAPATTRSRSLRSSEKPGLCSTYSI